MNSSITPFIQLIVCLSAALGTYQLIHRFHFSAIRASAFITCLFCLIVLFSGQSILKTQEALFFGGTFVGMSSFEKLGKLGIIFSASLYLVLYLILAGWLQGIGGALGTIAFLSCSSVLLIKKHLLKI